MFSTVGVATTANKRRRFGKEHLIVVWGKALENHKH
jgi:hypothetical protein